MSSISTPSPEFAQFEKYTKGIGSKLLKKMGYKPGMGLGANGTGIVEPIDVKLRPQKMGLGHGGFDERTENAKKTQKPSSNIAENQNIPLVQKPWKKASKKSSYISQNTLKPVIAQESSVNYTTKIIDLTGKNARVVETMKDLIIQSKSNRLPELTFNIGIITDTYHSQLLNHSKTLSNETRKAEIATEESSFMEIKLDRDSKNLQECMGLLGCVRRIRDIMNNLNPKKDTAATQNDLAKDNLFQFKTAIDPQFQFTPQSQIVNYNHTWKTLQSNFNPEFQILQDEYMQYVREHSLDNLVVASITPTVKNIIQNWNILENPNAGADVLLTWLPILDLKESVLYCDSNPDCQMSAYENMLFSLWLPRIRQFINNSWSPKSPDAIILVLESWDKVLPRWLHHNIFEQLIIPKIKRELDNWNPKKDTIALHVWLFPWLPVIHDKFENAGIWESVRLKMTLCLSDWHPRDSRGLDMLLPWKQVFDSKDIESIVTKSVLPKLISVLRMDFVVNPASQDIEPLNWIFSWLNSEMLSIANTVHLLETEFFPKWHIVLFKWLKSPGVSLEEVTMWYTTWKKVFPESCKASLNNQFRYGLDLMNLAMMEELKDMPPPPIPLALQESQTNPKLHKKQARKEQLTFMDYVERVSEQSGVELVPLDKVHVESGKKLYKMTGISGVVIFCFVDNGVLFVSSDGKEYTPKGVQLVIEELSENV